MKNKLWNKLIILFSAIATIGCLIDIILYTDIIKEKTIPYLWADASVKLLVTLPTPIIDGQPFEYCILKEDAGLWNKQRAGTPVPMDPVFLGPTPTEVAAKETPYPIGPTPTLEPTATQPVYDEIGDWQVEVINIGKFKQNNFHLVVIGVGYTKGENESKLRTIISQLEANFKGVRVDFAYVRSPLNLNLKHIETWVNFSNGEDFGKLMAKIKKVYPVDSVVISIDTPSGIGTSDAWHWAMVTGTDPPSILWASHEIGHLLGLGDGYKAYYPERFIPNSELFYLDEMPRILSDALSKLKSIPPIYEVGTCNGRKLYTFYERSNNIMSDYNPQGPNSWGDSLFTPLQIQVMNNFVAILKWGS
jgi:hypothetical protein